LEPGTTLSLWLDLAEPPLEVQARIQWCRPHGPQQWRVGASFEGDTAHIQAHLEYVEKAEGAAAELFLRRRQPLRPTA
jgi:hypothetical protein